MAQIRSYQSDGEKWLIVLDETPFYAESGGQIGDTGILRNDGVEFKVTDTQKDGNVILHLSANGRLYQIEKAANILGPWQPISPIDSTANAATYTDLGALDTQPAAFYRIQTW